MTWTSQGDGNRAGVLRGKRGGINRKEDGKEYCDRECPEHGKWPRALRRLQVVAQQFTYFSVQSGPPVLAYLAKSQNRHRLASMDTHPLIDIASQPEPDREAKSSNPQGLSKKAQKRAAKAARLHELKLERRAREKEAKKYKRRERALAIARGEIDANTPRKRRRTNVGGETEIFNARVVVDLGFDDLMSDKVGVSLCSSLPLETIMPRIGDQFSYFSIGVYVQRKQTCRARILGATIHLA